MVRTDDGLSDGGIERVERRKEIELYDIERAETACSCAAKKVGFRGLIQILENVLKLQI